MCEKILGQLASARFLQGYEIYRAFLTRVLHEEKRWKFQNHVKIEHIPSTSNSFSLNSIRPSDRLFSKPAKRCH